MCLARKIAYIRHEGQATFLSNSIFFFFFLFTSVGFAARFPFSFVRQSPGNATCKPPMHTGSATVLCKYTQKYVHACGRKVASRMRCTRIRCVCSPRVNTSAKHPPRLVSVLFNPHDYLPLHSQSKSPRLQGYLPVNPLINTRRSLPARNTLSFVSSSLDQFSSCLSVALSYREIPFLSVHCFMLDVFFNFFFNFNAFEK